MGIIDLEDVGHEGPWLRSVIHTGHEHISSYMAALARHDNTLLVPYDCSDYWLVLGCMNISFVTYTGR